MKEKILSGSIIAILLFSLSLVAYGQTEKYNGFSFQAVARDNDGKPIAEQEINVIVSIQTPGEEIVWEEAHTVSTSSLGLFTIGIGTMPDAVTKRSVKDLSELEWQNVTYTLNVTVNNTYMGSEPILSVPVALYGRDEDADPSNEIQDIQLSNGQLGLTGSDQNVDLATYVQSQNPWASGTGTVTYSSGKVGVGTVTPEGVMDVVSAVDQIDTMPIFQVKNKDGMPVFSVYNEGVRILFPDDVSLAKGVKGGFAVGGYNTSKASESASFLQVMPQGANINFFADESAKSDSKSLKGGFAVGGYNTSKSDESSFIYMDPYAVPITYDGGTVIIFPLFDALYPKGNCFLGTMSGQNHEGHFNTSIGYQAGFSMEAGMYFNDPIFYSNNASYNTFLGAFAGYATDLGDKNVYLGYQAGYNNVGSGNVFIGFQSGAAATNLSNKLYIDNEDTTLPLIQGDFDADYLRIYGNVGIGTSSSTSYGLVVNGGTSSNYSIYAYKGGYTNGSWYGASDERFKENIQPIENAIDKIMAIKGVTFDWKTSTFSEMEFSDRQQIGVIAQDLEKVLPELVSEDEQGYKAVAYDKLTAVLIEAIKEQQDVIEKQQLEIEALKANEGSTEEMLKTIADLQETIIRMNDRISSMEKYSQK